MAFYFYVTVRCFNVTSFCQSCGRTVQRWTIPAVQCEVQLIEQWRVYRIYADSVLCLNTRYNVG